MKTLFYPTLAVNGMTKNRKTYLPYTLTCIGMVMMFYLLSFLSRNESVRAMEGGQDMQVILSLGTGVIAVFAVIFLFYTYSFLIRKRKKEFGLYNILGMGKWNIARILCCESGLIAIVTIVAGLGCGVLFSKLMELFAAKMLGGKANFTFTIEWSSVRSTVALFLIAYALIFLNALRQIHLSNPIELLHSDKVGEKPPKARWLLALIGLGVLGGAYYISATIEDPMEAIKLFFIAVLMVICATYLLFIVGSVAFCNLLQKNKRYYYKTNHFVSVSSMAYRMKRNGASLASICILSTMVLVMISSTLCLYVGKEDNIRSRFPRDFILETMTDDWTQAQQVDAAVGEVLAAHGFEAENEMRYQYLSAVSFVEGDTFYVNPADVSVTDQYNTSQLMHLLFCTLDDYNRIMQTSETLNAGEVLTFCSGKKGNHDVINLKDYTPFQVKNQVAEMALDNASVLSAISLMGIVVQDEQTLHELQTFLAAQFEDPKEASQIAVRQHQAFDLAQSDDVMQTIYAELRKEADALMAADESFPMVEIECIAEERDSFYAMYSGLFLLGIILSVVFIAAAVLIMYYKQISEGYEDCARFEIMQKVGMTRQEIRRSINSQVLTVFGLPLLTAGLHVGFALPIVVKLLRLFGLFNTGLFIAVTAGCYLVFAVFYVLVYHITSRSYYNIVSGK